MKNDSGSDLRPGLALRLAARQLRRAPGAAVYAALTLAVGLGAAIAIDAVKASFNAPLPVGDGDGVVQVRLADPQNGKTALGAADLRAWRGESRSLRVLGAFSTFDKALSRPGLATRRVLGATVTEEVFGLLGVEPRLGRVPGRDSNDTGAVVISHRLWQSWLEGDSQVLGRTVRLGGETRTVAGVMPEGFRFPFHQDVWEVRDLDTVAAAGAEAVARLAGGVGREEAGRELTAILARTRVPVDGTAESTARARVAGFTEERGESGETRLLRALFWLVLALTLVSCLNVSNLLLERAAARARSLSLHQALGAVPGQIGLQVLVEALLIAGLGALLGLAVAQGIVAFVQTSLVDHWGYFWMKVELSPSALGLAAALAVLTALAAGGLPAWRARRADLVEALKQEARSSRGRKAWASRLLIAGQMTFSCLVVLASVLLGLGLLESRRVRDGFPADEVLWTSLNLDGERYATPEARRRYRETLLAELERQPAVAAAAVGSGLPGVRSPFRKVTLPGEALTEETRGVAVSGVTAAFFDTFDIRILDGRAFLEGETSAAIAVVSEGFVRRRLDGGPALGRTIRLHGRGEEVDELRIVGVAADVLIYDRDDARPLENVYLPLGQDDTRQLLVAVRAGGERSEAIAALAGASLAADPDVALGEIRSVAEWLSYARRIWETLGTLAALGGLGAVLVVTIGLYGLLAVDVRQRLPEFAVRLALGAGTGRILTDVLRQAFLLVLPGVALGLGLTYLVTPLLGVYIGGADSHDPRVFGGALAVYALILLAATLSPARRAAGCNLVELLRQE